MCAGQEGAIFGRRIGVFTAHCDDATMIYSIDLCVTAAVLGLIGQSVN